MAYKSHAIYCITYYTNAFEVVASYVCHEVRDINRKERHRQTGEIRGVSLRRSNKGVVLDGSHDIFEEDL